MKTQTFNLSKPPLLLYDKVAYLVDYKNVELFHQYIEKYYSKLELEWFEDLIMTEIRENNEFILYFGVRGFTYDGNHKNTEAYTEHFTIYYVTKALMIIE